MDNLIHCVSEEIFCPNACKYSTYSKLHSS